MARVAVAALATRYLNAVSATSWSITGSREVANHRIVMSTALTILPLLLVVAAAFTIKACAAALEALPGCQDSCGGTAIRYPFGIGAGCYRPGFQIICDGGTPVLFGTTRAVPLSNLSISTAEALVMLPVAWQCYNSSDEVYDVDYGDVQFNKAGVYRISNARNQVVVVGCNSLGYTESQRSEGNDYSYAYYTGCMCFSATTPRAPWTASAPASGAAMSTSSRPASPTTT